MFFLPTLVATQWIGRSCDVGIVDALVHITFTEVYI
jgi:hypothetical protein